MIQNPMIIKKGGGSAPSGHLDPVQVYNDTRPSDWLPMPTPNDNEMYLLFHIPIPDGASSLLAFTVTCTGNYTVELGNTRNGVFAQYSSTSIASGSTYETELFAIRYGDLTSDGMRQVMVKVSGTDILTWEPSTHSKKTSPTNFAGWNVVEIRGKLPKATKVQCGNITDTLALRKLRYFSLNGSNTITSMGSMFRNCNSLTSIPALDTSSVTDMTYMFYNCNSLTSIPALDTSSVTDMTYMFYNCNSLTSIPALDTSSVTSMAYMLYNCYSLTSIPALDTSSVTSMTKMIRNCYSLTYIPSLDMSSVKSMGGMFYNCYSLESVLLVSTVYGWAGYNISLSDCSFGHKAIVELFECLPTIPSAKAIDLTGNPGVSELTDEEKAIATGKGWTLTL